MDPMDNNTKLRINSLRAERFLRGFSQQRIAESIGVSQMWISRLERGGCARITEDRAEAIAAVLDVPVEELFEPSEEGEE